jgi:hypothetical protein
MKGVIILNNTDQRCCILRDFIFDMDIHLASALSKWGPAVEFCVCLVVGSLVFMFSVVTQ